MHPEEGFLLDERGGDRRLEYDSLRSKPDPVMFQNSAEITFCKIKQLNTHHRRKSRPIRQVKSTQLFIRIDRTRILSNPRGYPYEKNREFQVGLTIDVSSCSRSRFVLRRCVRYSTRLPKRDSTGNRLIRFTGDYLAGDFSHEVISDLSAAVVADIDDLGPGVGEDGEITDNPGFAIDSGTIYNFNYQTGTGNNFGNGGTWGIHALGGELFADVVSRVYVLTSTAELYEFDFVNNQLSGLLKKGPAVDNGHAGWSGLTGPLTDCETGFVN